MYEYKRIDLRANLLSEIREFQYEFERKTGKSPNKIIISFDMLKKLELYYHITFSYKNNTIFGMEIEIDNSLSEDVIKLVKEDNFMGNRYSVNEYIREDILATETVIDKKWFFDDRKPKHYIINKRSYDTVLGGRH